MSTEAFKERLDEWLKIVAVEPKSDNYAMCAAAENNSTVKQAVHMVSVTS